MSKGILGIAGDRERGSHFRRTTHTLTRTDYKENQASPERALNIQNMEGKVHIIGNVLFAWVKGKQAGH